ncbi:MAG: anhydro-N-acetylmuramic acid kinase [Roseivirga sp.]|jgi:anhydro-N-acetylmuramic acid kinase|uniref:anhydro-N-acetylmuramic acid kinase n=1 Tax=Roseivirga sp. TaxID=1964215 RepID=UPI001B28F279|nr:anhydro-N-acetylmuramic acid kinase [Roseivirga sp.]MBO6494203.1 anhydro-N-acetylmuramic acid kinase [Roseivirga sp.]
MMVKNQITILGIMSGTSLDGLDLAETFFCRESNKASWSFELNKCETIPYPKELSHRLRHAIELSEEGIQKLDIDLGVFIGKSINKFLGTRSQMVDCVASHGHTVFHQPEKGITVQIGSGEEINDHCQISVINNFRVADVKAGGQGAPLVPIGDRDLFAAYDFALNLGGIANISFEKEDKRVAFDICPFNMALNYLANEKGLPYDSEGKIAATGRINESLLSELSQLPYLSQRGPKSLGIEDYQKNWLPLLKNSSISLEDKMATFIEHSAMEIASTINENKGKKVLVTGGGAYHQFFISRLKAYSRADIVLPESKIIEFKEALIFAYLGLLRLEGKPNCLSSVTGAEYDVSAGDLIGF